MKKSIFAICDPEAAYACSLAEYVNEKKLTPFEAQAFTGEESLLAYAEKHEIELLLLSTQIKSSEARSLCPGRTILLSEGDGGTETEEPSVFKYQASDSLTREVMEYYIRDHPQPQLFAVNTKKTKLYGIFSPLGRTRKTSFALALGEVLAEKGKVLYLNFEEFSGFGELIGQENSTDMTDLIYFLRQKDENFLFHLSSVIRTLGGLEYIPPALSPLDLLEVSGEEWLAFLQEVAGFREYDAVLLDLSWQIDGLFAILKSCDRIYMPVLDDMISLAKLKQYEQLMRLLDMEEILKKTLRIRPPLQPLSKEGGALTRQLLWGEMGSYVRQLLMREEHPDG